MINILLVIAAAYLALIGLMFLAQNWLLFHPMSPIVTMPDQHDMSYEDVELTTDDGEVIHAWWIPAEEDRGALLFLHGNAGNISGRIPSIRQFHDLGLSVLIVSYRGYGQSSGSPTETGLYLDGAAAYQHLVDERGIEPQNIVAFGRSLGTGVATFLAFEYDVGALLLESPFTSVPDLAASHYPWIPSKRLVRNDFNNLERVKEMDTPLLVLHSPDDRIIPYHFGEELYEAASEPKEFFQLQGGHNDGFSVSEPEYSAQIDRFLTRHGFPR